MNRYARIIRFYTSEGGGDIDHFGLGLPTDDHENGWKVCFDKKVIAIVAAKTDVLPVPTAREAFDKFNRAVTDAQVQLNKDLDKLDKLEDQCALLEMVSVVWPKNRR